MKIQLSLKELQLIREGLDDKESESLYRSDRYYEIRDVHLKIEKAIVKKIKQLEK